MAALECVGLFNRIRFTVATNGSKALEETDIHVV